MKIEELFVKDIKYEKWDKKKPKSSPMSKEQCDKYRTIIKEQNVKPTTKFEKEVLNYLFENRKQLGIEEVYALENMHIDGAMKLTNGTTILLEIKYALNWRNCCNAKVAIQRFIQEELFKTLPTNQIPERALVIFNHFSGDWAKKKENHIHDNGWSFFYEEEEVLRKKLPTIPVDIAQLTEKGLDNPLLRPF